MLISYVSDSLLSVRKTQDAQIDVKAVLDVGFLPILIHPCGKILYLDGGFGSQTE